eukprot:COSAG06_NODE_64311_length_260_cov_0.515528_1_plen_26_part_10
MLDLLVLVALRAHQAAIQRVGKENSA